MNSARPMHMQATTSAADSGNGFALLQKQPQGRSSSASSRHRFMSGVAAACAAALLVTPFDVVKTRMQAQGNPRRCNSLTDLRPCCDVGGKTASTAYPSSTATMLSIAKNEGIPALWRGTGAALTMSLPTVGLYMTAYDKLRDAGKQHGWTGSTSAAAAGAASRCLAVSVTSPLELVRTRLQAAAPSASLGCERIMAPEPKGDGILKGLVAQVRSQGLMSLWRGLGPSLARDVPFSAIYWVGVEALRPRIARISASTPIWGAEVSDGPAAPGFLPNLVAGALAGVLAALVTHPFDVLKTNIQVSGSTNAASSVAVADYSTRAAFKQVIQSTGPQGLWVGLAPRLAKVAPSCAVVLGTYELLKNWS